MSEIFYRYFIGKKFSPCYRTVFFITLAFSFLTSQVAAQETDTSIIDIAAIRFYSTLTEKAMIASAPNGLPEKSIPGLEYQKGLIKKYQAGFPGALIEKTIFLKFSLTNSGDTTKSVIFTPGFFSRHIVLYKASPDNIEESFHRISDSISKSDQYAGCKVITLHPKESSIYFAGFNMLRTSSTQFQPRIVENDFLKPWLQGRKQSDSSQDIATYVASGILLLMIFYSIAVYLQNRNKEFIYYSGYALCTGVLLFLKSFLSHDYSGFNFLYEEYLDFMIMCAGVFFYLTFVRRFLNTRERHPFLERFLSFAEIILLCLLLIFSFIYFFTDRYVILNIMENYVIKFFIFIIGITFIIYSIKRKNKLLNYLAAGNIALVLFSFISLSLLLFRWKLIEGNPGHILNRSMFYYELGLVLELMFFLAGLAYKNRCDIIEQVKENERFKLENERKEFEKQMAVMTAQQDERNRISADMHDELGSGVTAIRLMSEIVKSKMKGKSMPEIEKISHSANELIGKMNTIIWTMKSSNDSLESLAAYIRAYAIEYFDGTHINCYVNISVLPDIEMTGEKRRNIFLSIKEGLNNILKHAHATEVRIDILVSDKLLDITIQDNGVGIDTNKFRRFGNGLSNMKRRMQSINGEFDVKTDGGTFLLFQIPI